MVQNTILYWSCQSWSHVFPVVFLFKGAIKITQTNKVLILDAKYAIETETILFIFIPLKLLDDNPRKAPPQNV